MFVINFVQPQIYSTSEIADKCATTLVRQDATALIRPILLLYFIRKIFQEIFDLSIHVYK